MPRRSAHNHRASRRSGSAGATQFAGEPYQRTPQRHAGRRRSERPVSSKDAGPHETEHGKSLKHAGQSWDFTSRRGHDLPPHRQVHEVIRVKLAATPTPATPVDTTDGSLVFTPGDPQPAGALSNLAEGAADTMDGDPAPVTIMVTATRADDTVELEPEPERVPVLPLLAQLLLALGLLAGAGRLARRRA